MLEWSRFSERAWPVLAGSPDGMEQVGEAPGATGESDEDVWRPLTVYEISRFPQSPQAPLPIDVRFVAGSRALRVGLGHAQGAPEVARSNEPDGAVLAPGASAQAVAAAALGLQKGIVRGERQCGEYAVERLLIGVVRAGVPAGRADGDGDGVLAGIGSHAGRWVEGQCGAPANERQSSMIGSDRNIRSTLHRSNWLRSATNTLILGCARTSS